MAVTLGSLVVALGLDTATFTAGADRASYQAAKLAKEIGENLEKATAVAITGFASLTTGAIGYLAIADRITESVAGYQDLADKMGESASAVASLQRAADISDVSLESVAAASVKLTTSLAKVSDETKGAGKALAALGINVEDFKRLSPADQLETVARAMAGFEDSSSKTAVAVALFGKAGAEVIPFLKDLADEGRSNVKVTEAQIRAADEYSKTKARLSSDLKSFAQVLSVSVTPVLGDLATALLKAANETINVGNETTVLNTGNKLQEWANKAVGALTFVLDSGDGVKRTFEAIGKTIGASAAQFVQIAQGNFAGANAIGQAWLEDMAALAKAPMLGSQIRASYEAAAEARRKLISDNGFVGPQVPRLRFEADADKKDTKDPDAEAKSYLENLQRSQNKLEDLTAVSTLLSDIDSGRLKILNPLLRDQLLAQAAIVDMTKDQIRLDKEAEEAAKKSKAEAKAAQDRLDKEIEKYREQAVGPIERAAKIADRIRELQDQGYLSAEEASAAIDAEWSMVLKKTESRVEETNVFIEQAKRNAQGILSDALSDAVLGKFQGGLRGMLRLWATAMAQMAAQASAANLMKSAFGATSGGGGFWASIFGGGRASGGSVAPGTSYLVGERGPEILTMGQSPGYVTPNTGGGGGDVAVNTTINVDANGTRTDRTTAAGNAQQLGAMVEQITRAAIAKETQQGGILWRMRAGAA